MAIIQLARRNSVSETALKVLDVKTANLDLVNGRILMSQTSDGLNYATKLSLFVGRSDILPESRTIGERNVWLRDVDDGVMICYGHEREAYKFCKVLLLTHDWVSAFPDTHRAIYNLKHLDRAAEDMRNFLLLGALPSMGLSDEQKDMVDQALKKGKIDVFATIDIELVYIGEDRF